jgi:hypothetical protein
VPRGQQAEIGDERFAPNGYHYTRTKDGWELTHRLLIGLRRGRPLLSSERVKFIDGDKTNMDEDNLEVYVIKSKSIKSRRARLQARIEDLQAELDALDEEF